MWDNKIFFEKLNVLLKDRGWSLCELSVQAGLSTGMIYRWRNHNQVPSMESLQKIGDALGVPVDYFLNNDSSTNHKNKIELLSIMASKLTVNQLDAVIEIVRILSRDNK